MTETPDTDTTTTSAVRVPNVRPGALSGLSYEPLIAQRLAGAGEAVNADTGQVTAPGEPLPPIETTDGEPLLPVVPDDLTTVDALLAWVGDTEDEDDRVSRASAVLNAEAARPEEARRTTLVTLLEAMLAPASESSD